ncbi:MAG: tetratricopeptide repeat protein [Ignavibacteria bacterium]|nr:tetratricopeptide repeat protein [Ignavibacteria bacterium]
MFKIFSPLILLLFVNVSFSQVDVDSLMRDLQSKTNGEKIDSSALNTLEKLAEYYHQDDPIKTLEYSNKYLITARNYNDKKSIAHAYHYLGDYYRDEGLPIIAIDYYFSSMYIYEELNFPGAVAYTNIDVGNIYFDLGKHDIAKQYYEKVINMPDEKDVIIAKAVALNNIGLIYREAKDYSNALKKFEEALEIRKKANDKNLIAHSYNYIGSIYTSLNKFDEAEKYYNQSLQLYKEINDYSDMGKVMMNIGKLYYEKSEKEKSVAYRNDAVKLFLDKNKLFAAADAMTDLAEFHKSDGNISEALNHSFRAYKIATENKYTSLRQQSLKLLSDLNLINNNIQEAYNYLKIFDDLKDSIAQREAQRKLVNLEFSNEFQRRDREMSSMKSENQLKQLTIENQSRKNTFLLIITTAIFVLLVVIFFAFRLQRKSLKILQDRNKVIDENNKKIEISMKMLEDAKEEAEKNARIKSEFLSIMSHELRTPMNAVLGMTQVIMEENPRKDQLENLETIKISAQNLLDIINDILDYNRLESGKIFLEHKDFSLKNLMAKLFRIFSYSMKQKGLTLNYNYDSNLSDSFIGDEIRLGEIITNLIGNAIKFTDSGAITVDIKKIGNKPNTSLIRFSVKDTGIGISQQNITNIFDSFTQEKTDTTRKYGGTGLGLSIVKKLLELMNGRIFVESKVGEGSKFYFEIELENSDKKFEQVIKEPESAPNKINLSKILIVEDNTVNQLVMKKMLKNTGIEIDIADNGKIGFEKVLQNKYDLVFMDLLMPEMDGYEATKEIRNFNKDIPIVALTADVMKGVEAKTKEAGMNNYLTKPVKKDELLKILSLYSN